MQKTLNYNEQKVRIGRASCIGENGFLLPLHKMNFYDKLELFEHRNGLNDRAKTKTLHVSLNFSEREQYDAKFFVRIAEEYMTQIGFGEQPFLVYQHKDAGHPHIHILSTTIRSDGSRINTHNLGRTKSEIARKFLEVKYNLVKAEDSRKPVHKINPVDPQKVYYGKIETKGGIEGVLNGVVNTYNYTSLAELNAILKQFNVMADRCAPDGFIYSKKGLYYRVLYSNGVRIGVPIKASLVNGKPTLENLEKCFQKNLLVRAPLREKLKLIIEDALSHGPKSIADLSTYLSSNNVTVVRRENDDGRLYGITFVDHANKSVFNGSEIDRQFSVAGLLKQMNNPPSIKEKSYTQGKVQKSKAAEKGFIEFNGLLPLSTLMAVEAEFNPTPYHLKKKKRKRKR